MNLPRLSSFAVGVALGVTLSNFGMSETSPSALTMQSQRSNVVTIKGSEHPELLPEHIVWEFFFRHFVAFARMDAPAGGGFSEERIEALSRYELKIPLQDVRTFLDVADETLKKVDGLRADADQPGSPERLSTQRQRTAELILEGRDTLATKLSNASFLRIRQRAAKSARGIEIDIPIK